MIMCDIFQVIKSTFFRLQIFRSHFGSFFCANNDMEYAEDTLFDDNTDVTDDGQDGKDYKGKCCVISAIFRVRILTGN